MVESQQKFHTICSDVYIAKSVEEKFNVRAVRLRALIPHVKTCVVNIAALSVPGRKPDGCHCEQVCTLSLDSASFPILELY